MNVYSHSFDRLSQPAGRSFRELASRSARVESLVTGQAAKGALKSMTRAKCETKRRKRCVARAAPEFDSKRRSVAGASLD